jgi:hypothetical protein
MRGVADKTVVMLWSFFFLLYNDLRFWMIWL